MSGTHALMAHAQTLGSRERTSLPWSQNSKWKLPWCIHLFYYRYQKARIPRINDGVQLFASAQLNKSLFIHLTNKYITDY